MDASDRPPPAPAPPQLRREIGIFAATMMGLGSIVGTGIFVSFGLAAQSAGPAVIVATGLAALVAACNGLASAQLAAAHPVSGGTYEYGYRWLHPCLGFTAGWMFVCAKSASAATAALGCAGYALDLLGQGHSAWRTPLALLTVLLLTLVVLRGLRLSSVANMVVVSLTLASLLVFVVLCLPRAVQDAPAHLTPLIPQTRSDLPGFLEACALMFVAYTGYGRIATLGEEIRDPRRNIPIAILVTLLAAMVLYVVVTTVAIGSVGASALAAATSHQHAPLEYVACQAGAPVAAVAVSIGAITSMLGVLLNLLLGLSRVVLAMGRRQDLPAVFARLDATGVTPVPAVIGVGLVIGSLVLIGNVKTTWSFSAFSVLVYYALTNLAALRLSASERRYPRVLSWLGLFSCAALAFRVERSVWLSGMGLIALGLAWWYVQRRLNPRQANR